MNNIYIPTRKPGSWWDMVSPREEEMPGFLRAYMGKGMQFRTPKRMWQDLWMRKRGEMNHVMGMRKFGTITNFKGPKYQKGMIVIAAGIHGGVGTQPNLQNITHLNTQTGQGGTDQTMVVAYDSDGGIVSDLTATITGGIIYIAFEEQSDDSNVHTNDWWPDQPETNEGLNWDIRFDNEVLGGVGGAAHYFAEASSQTRTSGTWYLLDTVSNDITDGLFDGAIRHFRANGIAKSPQYGTSTLAVDVEISVKDNSTAVASHTYDFTITNNV